ELVKEYGGKYELPYVILRPGYVFGPGKRELSGRIGNKTFGLFVQVSGAQSLPLTFVDNCAEAIVLAGLRHGIDGEVFNVVDDELITAREFLKAYRNKAKSLRSIRLPYVVGYTMSLLWEKYSSMSTRSIAFLIVKLSLFVIENRSWRSSWANVLGFLHAFLNYRKCWRRSGSMLFILQLRHRAIIRLPNNALNPEAMFIWKNLSP